MILVTGGTGLVGAHLLHKLCLTNNRLVATYRTEKSKETTLNIFKYYNNTALFDKIEWRKADLNDIPALENAFKNITKVYHAAAMVSFNTKDQTKLLKTNIEGTANIVNLCIYHNIQKLCYVSSIATFNKKPKQDFIDESCDWNPEKINSDYAISKYGAEMEVWRGSQEGLPVVIVNPGLIFGFGNWSANTSQLFSKIKKGLPFYTTGITGVVDVQDVVNALTLLMNSNVEGENFILCAENKSYQEIFTLIAKSLNVKAPSLKASKFSTELAWRLGYILNILSFNYFKPSMHKFSSKSSHNQTYYEGDKIKKYIPFNYTSFNTTIENIGKKFLL